MESIPGLLKSSKIPSQKSFYDLQPFLRVTGGNLLTHHAPFHHHQFSPVLPPHLPPSSRPHHHLSPHPFPHMVYWPYPSPPISPNAYHFPLAPPPPSHHHHHPMAPPLLGSGGHSTAASSPVLSSPGGAAQQDLVAVHNTTLVNTAFSYQ